MSLESLSWRTEAAGDIHLLPEHLGPRLDQLLEAAISGERKRGDELPNSVTLDFTHSFPPTSTSGLTVTLDPTSGVVRLAALPPLPQVRILDFVVTATATEGSESFSIHRRFQVHNAIAKIWLTPNPLTVRQGARSSRLTVLAEFDDGTYGDLTPWTGWLSGALDRCHVRRRGRDDPAIAWSFPPGSAVGVDPASGRLRAAGSSGDVPITAQTDAAPGGMRHTAVATVRAAPPWNTPATVRPLSGAAGPGANARNVLILPDGFERGEEASFRKLAREMAHRVERRAGLIKPFNLLRRRLKYFTAWVESPQGGISPLEAVTLSGSGSRARATEQDLSVPAATIQTTWHDGVGAPLGGVQQILLNERDTAFHVALGARPAAVRAAPMRAPGPLSARLDEEDFDEFLAALKAPDGSAIGQRWTSTGADKDLVLILCRSRRTGGANHRREAGPGSTQAIDGRRTCMTWGNARSHRVTDAAGGLGKDLVADPTPQRASIVGYARMAHELAHSFMLGDEYSSSEATLPKEYGLSGFHNLQPRTQLLVSKKLNSNGIKWRWPRIRSAGILASAPISLPNPAPDGSAQFRVTLRRRHGRLFAEGDVVRFRQRELPSAHPPPPAAFSGRLRVVSLQNDEVTLKALAPNPLAARTPAVGDLLINPVRDPHPPFGNPLGDDLEMVHAAVRARIDERENPLNAGENQSKNKDCIGSTTYPTPATLFPKGAGPLRDKLSYRLVGLFEGGAGYKCGVYHPTGMCLMRTLADPRTGSSRAGALCPVCRYVLVDTIDPTKHGAIDREYGRRYPR